MKEVIESVHCPCDFFLVLKLLYFQKYGNGGGGEVEALCGVVVASHGFQIAIFQIKFIKME